MWEIKQEGKASVLSNGKARISLEGSVYDPDIEELRMQLVAGVEPMYLVTRLRNVIKAFKIRVAFIGHPKERMNEHGPDWSEELKAADEVLNFSRDRPEYYPGNGICRGHAMAVLVCHVDDGMPCSDYHGAYTWRP